MIHIQEPPAPQIRFIDLQTPSDFFLKGFFVSPAFTAFCLQVYVLPMSFYEEGSVFHSGVIKLFYCRVNRLFPIAIYCQVVVFLILVF